VSGSALALQLFCIGGALVIVLMLLCPK